MDERDLVMKFTLATVVALLFSFQSYAKVLVVSDIDDTLKVTHVHSKGRQVGSFFDTRSRFIGMAEVFQQLQTQNDDIEFHYVTRASDKLMKFQHTKFLSRHKFPEGVVHFKESVGEDLDMKQRVIRKIISEVKPDSIVFFGDNGQYDVVAYQQMTEEFPKIPTVTYIREVYSKNGKAEYPTRDGQIGFVTSVEIVMDLIALNLLPQSSYQPIEDVVYDRLLKDDGNENFGPMVFPGWQDCRDFHWNWEVSNPSEKLNAILAVIEEKCWL
jgi:hypothetical protein